MSLDNTSHPGRPDATSERGTIGLMSQSSSGSNDRPGRRVSARVAICVVLLCGSMGFVLGSVYPPELLVARWQVATSPPPSFSMPPAEEIPAPGKMATPGLAAQAPPAAAPVESDEPSPAVAAGLAPTTLARGADERGGPAPPSPTILNKAPLYLSPAPERASPQVEPAPPKTASVAAKEIRRADRRSGEPRKLSPAERSARAKRNRYAEPQTTPPPAQPKSVISQIPIVGPVVGQFLPF
jgi:hypothetical protein